MKIPLQNLSELIFSKKQGHQNVSRLFYPIKTFSNTVKLWLRAQLLKKIWHA